MNYATWIKNNTSSLKNKNVFFVGGTGSIGFEALKIIASLGANIVLGARNVVKAESIKEKLLQSYSVHIEIKKVDVSSLKSIDKLIDSFTNENQKFDYFFNNAGVYHLNPQINDEGHEITYATNTLGCIYLVEKMLPFMKKHGVINVTSSISYRFFKLNYDDIASLKVSNKLKKYSLTKLVMLKAFLNIKKSHVEDDLTFNLVHPGICPSELFSKGYSKLFMVCVFPIMKVIFHSPKKACLSLIKGLFTKTDFASWIGPRGLFGAWGYPKVSKLNQKAFENIDVVYNYLLNQQREK